MPGRLDGRPTNAARLWFVVLVVQHAVTQTREGKNPDHGKDGKRHATSVEIHWPHRRHCHPPCGLPLSTPVILDTGRYGYPRLHEPQATLGGSLPHPRRVSWHPRHICNSMDILCVLDAATGKVIIDAISVHPSWKGFLHIRERTKFVIKKPGSCLHASHWKNNMRFINQRSVLLDRII